VLLLEGAIGPEPHSGFVGFFDPAAFCDGDGAVARAGKDVAAVN
jgi:hypothetical protein